MFFIFFLVRLLVRNQWVAVAAVVVLFGLPAVFAPDNPALHAVENMLVFGTALLLLVRFGLLALLVALCVNNVLEAYPLTGHLCGVVRAADDSGVSDGDGVGGVWVLHGDGGEVAVGRDFVGGVRSTGGGVRFL